MPSNESKQLSPRADREVAVFRSYIVAVHITSASLHFVVPLIYGNHCKATFCGTSIISHKNSGFLGISEGLNPVKRRMDNSLSQCPELQDFCALLAPQKVITDLQTPSQGSSKQSVIYRRCTRLWRVLCLGRCRWSLTIQLQYGKLRGINASPTGKIIPNFVSFFLYEASLAIRCPWKKSHDLFLSGTEDFIIRCFGVLDLLRCRKKWLN